MRKKLCTLGFLAILSLTGCSSIEGTVFENDTVVVNTATFPTASSEESSSANFKVLDVRELYDDKFRGRESFIVNIVVERVPSGNRQYLSYTCYESKDEFYTSRAKLVAGDYISVDSSQKITFLSEDEVKEITNDN